MDLNAVADLWEKEVKQLRAQLAEAQKEIAHLRDVSLLQDYSKLTEDLRGKLRIATEALEWYAKASHWEWTTHESTYDGCGVTDLRIHKDPLCAPEQVGGKRAVEALAKLKGELLPDTTIKVEVDPTLKFDEWYFKGATCRGSYALGTACGRCERCKTEKVTNP